MFIFVRFKEFTSKIFRTEDEAAKAKISYVAKFEKVSFEQYKEDIMKYMNINDEEIIRSWYDKITIPRRSTELSAGYDFFVPFDVHINAGSENTVYPSGLRCKIEPGWCLITYPRSGLGRRNGFRLSGTVGIIDADYYDADNEGHMLIISNVEKDCIIPEGTAICQGLFTPFGITIDDDATGRRVGGFGSTTNVNKN